MSSSSDVLKGTSTIILSTIKGTLVSVGPGGAVAIVCPPLGAFMVFLGFEAGATYGSFKALMRQGDAKAMGRIESGLRKFSHDSREAYRELQAWADSQGR